MEALHMDAEGASADEEVGQLPTLPVPVNFPQQGTMVLLPLEGPDYDAQARPRLGLGFDKASCSLSSHCWSLQAAGYTGTASRKLLLACICTSL